MSASMFGHSNLGTKFFFDPFGLSHWSLREKVIFSPNVVNLIEALIT